MYSDEPLSPIGESSVPVPNRMLRRLKKAKTISDLFPGSETLDSGRANGEDSGKLGFHSAKDFDGFEEEDGPRSDHEDLGVEDGVTARKVLDFDSVPEFNIALEDLGKKGENEICDLETIEEIRVSEMKEAGKERPVFETSVLESNPALEDLSEKGEDELSDLETRDEIRISETKKSGDERPVLETSVPESDSTFEELGEKREEYIHDVEIEKETRDLEAKEAGTEQPVLETSEPESDSASEEWDEKGEEEIHDEEIGEETGDFEIKEAGKKRQVFETSDSEEKEKKRKKKRNKKIADFDELPVSTASKNMTKKERREYLDQLRAENQRLLRETRDAAFEPVPLVRKPISSVLEKIRRRKEEISKQFLSRKKVCHDLFREDGNDFEEVVAEEKDEDMNLKTTSKQKLGGQNCVEDSAGPSGNSDSPSNKNAESNPTQAPPLPSQTINSEDELLEKTSSRPLEEVMTPSVVAMNLKLNPSPARDDSSEEAEYNKENCEPDPHDLSPGDPVRKFIDEDAEEEDDSDNDLLRFEDEDEEDDEEDDDLKDMIVSQFKEDPIDKDRRNELHQKWLEEQDAAGTEKLLQKLKRGLQEDKTSLSEDEDEDDDADDDEEERAENADDEEVQKPKASEDEDEEDPSHANSMRMTMKKIKEMIPLMFTDEDDVYVSSDDEEMEKKLLQQRLYRKMELKNKLPTPTEEENSEEIFRRIKQTEIRKKAKPSSYKEKALMGINKNPAASKSSFLGRLNKSSASEGSRKRGSNIVRGYIFERDDSNSRSSMRDDSNSRSSMSMPEEPLVTETIVEEKSRPRRAPAKFTASQSQERSTLQATAVEEEKSSRKRTTLYEILKMSSKKSCFTSGKTVISSSHTESMFAAFKLDKKPTKTTNAQEKR